MKADDTTPDGERRAALSELTQTMQLVRAVEEALIRLFADSEVPGFIHLSLGQEAVAAGVMSALDVGDTMATTHRGHGHVLARGLALELFFKEIMGKHDGICAGRGGSMHVSDMALGIIGANGIVGAGIPIALGSALAHQVLGEPRVAVVFFGDGAMAEGVLHESLNIAALWKLPILFVCENNGWSEFSPTAEQFAAKLSDLAGAFGIVHERVEGSDVEAVASAARDRVAAIRAGAGPCVLECITHRVRGHYEGDPQKYREASELEGLSAHDPITRARAVLVNLGMPAEEIDSSIKAIEHRVNDAIAQARASALPDFSDALSGVYAPASQTAAVEVAR